MVTKTKVGFTLAGIVAMLFLMNYLIVDNTRACVSTGDVCEAEFGLSGGKMTRCYETQAEKDDWRSAPYCSEGWVEIPDNLTPPTINVQLLKDGYAYMDMIEEKPVRLIKGDYSFKDVGNSSDIRKYNCSYSLKEHTLAVYKLAKTEIIFSCDNDYDLDYWTNDISVQFESTESIEISWIETDVFEEVNKSYFNCTTQMNDSIFCYEYYTNVTQCNSWYIPSDNCTGYKNITVKKTNESLRVWYAVNVTNRYNTNGHRKLTMPAGRNNHSFFLYTQLNQTGTITKFNVTNNVTGYTWVIDPTVTGGNGVFGGNFFKMEIDVSGFLRLANNDTLKELPINQSFDGEINMTGNVLLMHLNNDSSLGENNTFFVDSSGMGNDGVCITCPDFNSSGKLNNAFRFVPANSDLINVTDSASLTIALDLTISVWFKRDIENLFGVFVSKQRTDSANGFSLQIRNTNVIQGVTGNGLNASVIGSVITDKDWHHLVYVRDNIGATQNGMAYLYLDGVLDASDDFSSSLSGLNEHLSIGERGGGGGLHFNGLIDEVGIWNRSLSATEILTIYNRQVSRFGGTHNASFSNITNCGADNCIWQSFNFITDISYRAVGELPDNQTVENDNTIRPINMTGNVGLWHLNNDSASQTDSSGTGNTGTVSGATFNSSGKLNGAYSFTAEGQSINISDDDSLSFGDGSNDFPLTIAAWVNADSLIHSINGIVTKDTILANREWALVSRNTGIIRFFMKDMTPSERQQSIDSTNAITTGIWHHVVVTYDGRGGNAAFEGITIYLNGIAEIPNTIINQTPYVAMENDNAPVLIGDDFPANDRTWQGRIDEVAIWNRSLSAQEISDIYKRAQIRLNFSVRSCDDIACSGESPVFLPSGQNSHNLIALGISQNRYFEWNLTANTDDFNITFELHNFTIEYMNETDAPQLTFTVPTEDTGTAFSRDWIFINVSMIEANPFNITFELSNSTDIFNSTTFNQADNNSNLTINFTNLPNELYSYRVFTFDILGNTNTTETRTITLDTINPNINFTTPTTQSGTFNQNFINANVTATDTNIDTVTAFLFNSTGQQLNHSIQTKVFKNISSGDACDSSFNFNLNPIFSPASNRTCEAISTFRITDIGCTPFPPPGDCWNDFDNATLFLTQNLSTSDPLTKTLASGTVIFSWLDADCEVQKNYQISVKFENETDTCVINTSDELFFQNETFFNFTNLADGTYFLNVTANDTAGNINSTETRTIILNTINPIINLFLNATLLTLGTDSVHIECNATDNINISTYLFNVTFPNGTLLTEDTSENTSIDLTPDNLTVAGNYTVNCFVNDTGNNRITNTSIFEVIPRLRCVKWFVGNKTSGQYVFSVDCEGNVNGSGNGTFSNIFGNYEHSINGSNHTGNLSSVRIMKDTGTNWLSRLLDFILDDLWDRDVSINKTLNSINNLSNSSIQKLANESEHYWNDTGDSGLTGDYNGSYNLNTNGNVIVTNASISDTLSLNNGNFYIDSEKKHIMRLGCTDVMNGDSNESFCFWHQEVHSEGTSANCILEGTNISNLRVVQCTQVGRNNSISYLGNSQFIGPNKICQFDGFNNGSHCDFNNMSNILNIYDFFNKTVFFAADTEGYGSTLFVQGGLDIWRQIRVLDDFLGFGKYTWIGEGDTVDFINTSLHPQLPITFTTGFNQSQEVPVISESFTFGLGVFSNEQTDLGNWQLTNAPTLCDDDTCVFSSAAGLGVVSMITNFNTLNVNQTQLNFVYSLINLIGSGLFSVTISNSTDSELLFSDGTNNVIGNSQSIDLSSVWSNQSDLNLTVLCNFGATNRPDRKCYIDTIILNGTAIEDTTKNVSGIISQYCGGDGIIQSNGECNRALIYDPQPDQWRFNGNVNFTGTVTGGAVSGTGTANTISKWSGITSQTNSIMTESGSTIVVAGSLNASLSARDINRNIASNCPTDSYQIGNGNNLSVRVCSNLTASAVNGTLWNQSGETILPNTATNLAIPGAITSGTLTITTANDGDSINVSDVNILFIDSSGGDITITGFTGGVNGQIIYLANIVTDNDVTIQHGVSVAQDIFLNGEDDILINNDYGGVILISNGVSWFESAHAI